MRVLHISMSNLIGGAAKAAYRIHKGLIEQGVDSLMYVRRKIGDDPLILGPSGFKEQLWSQLTPFAEMIPLKLLKIHPHF